MSAEPPRLICRRADFGPGAIGEDFAWEQIQPVELREALAGAVPMQGTRVRAAWSAEEWRVRFECDDADPWATLTERDAPLFQEETVEIFVDPVGDLESYYEMETNPLGAILDIVFRRSRSGYKGDWAWNCAGLRAAAQTVAGGWRAEFTIPFSSFAETPVSGTVWRANFCRIDRPARDGSQPRELSAWSPPLRESFHTPERFGFIEFAD